MSSSSHSATLAVFAVMRTWSLDPDIAAVCEVSPRGRSSNKQVFTVPVTGRGNRKPAHFELSAGEHTVRLYLPSGEVLAETISVNQGGFEEVTFDLRPSPHEWLSAESILGTVERLPDQAHQRALEAVSTALETALTTLAGAPALTGLEALASRSSLGEAPLRAAEHVRTLAGSALTRVLESSASIERISGATEVPHTHGKRWITDASRAKPSPDAELSPQDFVHSWTGYPVEMALLSITHWDERNAKLHSQKPSLISRTGERQRAFASVVDAVGDGYLAVLPEGWLSTSPERSLRRFEASVLTTVVTDAAGGSGEAARWRCSTSVGDLQAMTMLGLLTSGQTAPAEVFLLDAEDMLFCKFDNPVAAAIGAFLLLSYSEEANKESRPKWRDWIRNLYEKFPYLPDGAVAMAQLHLRYGEDPSCPDVDIEKLRECGLQAVRRGLPYLSFAVDALADLLLMLVHDDEAELRAGPEIDETRRAYARVRRLTRMMAPREHFTVLKLGELRL